MNPTECQRKRLEWMPYDVGGQYYGTGDYKTYVDGLKKQYADGGCGKDILMEKCLERQLYMDTLLNRISVLTQQLNTDTANAMKTTLSSVLKDFNASGCQKKIEESKAPILQNVISKFTNLDESRIDVNSIYERNKKIFFGASFLALGFLVILINKSDK